MAYAPLDATYPTDYALSPVTESNPLLEKHMDDVIISEYNELLTTLIDYIPTPDASNRVIMKDIMEKAARDETRIPLFSILINIQGVINHVTNKFHNLSTDEHRRAFKMVFNGHKNTPSILNRLKEKCKTGESDSPYFITVTKNTEYVRDYECSFDCYTIFLNFKPYDGKNEDVSTKRVDFRKARSCWFFSTTKMVLI
jgi:hypothetical protein